jgi:hypothetical protein
MSPRFRRFHGSAALDPTRIARDAGTIAEAVVQHLASLAGAKLSVTVEIEAEMPDGAPDKRRSNCDRKLPHAEFHLAGI